MVMSLNDAIRLARKRLAGEEISDVEAAEAYDILAEYHYLMGTMEKTFQYLKEN